MKKLGIFGLLLLFSVISANTSYGSGIDILTETLMNKNIIQPGEGQMIMTLSKEEQKKQEVKKKLGKLELGGDLRMRYQYQDKEGSVPRARQRIRFRLKGKAEMQKVEVGFRFATGGVDSRSTNETLDGFFATPDIRLDYAYAKYMPKKIGAIGGKFPGKKILWTPSDLLWDGDINLDGAGIMYSKKPVFVNCGILALDELKKNVKDPLMYTFQTGVMTKTGKAGIKVAATIYGLEHPYNIDTSDFYYGEISGGSNTRDASGNLKYDYDSAAGGIEVKFKDIILSSLFGEVINNLDPEEYNLGYLGGIKLKKGKASLKYMYRKLEKDAWPDIFPDSDSYGGKTGVEGSEIILGCKLTNKISAGIDYYMMNNIDENSDNVKTQHLVQADLKIKF
ncbi:MAG: putative porin [Elusimicrobiota bacterium]